MKKIIALAVVILLGLSLFSFTNAVGNKLSGYIYSETVGWISLSCINTNSCNIADYGVSANENGLLSGYGFAQNGEWVNFNPNYGGTNTNSENLVSGWAYSEKSDWLKISSAKMISAIDLQNEITSVNNMISNNSLSDTDTISLLNILCNKLLSSSECDILINTN
ncbi:MAG: hypothetical protein WCK10_01005 [Candidatus Staskawiczbacteria bacterium]